MGLAVGTVVDGAAAVDHLAEAVRLVVATGGGVEVVETAVAGDSLLVGRPERRILVASGIFGRMTSAGPAVAFWGTYLPVRLAERVQSRAGVGICSAEGSTQDAIRDDRP